MQKYEKVLVTILMNETNVYAHRYISLGVVDYILIEI